MNFVKYVEIHTHAKCVTLLINFTGIIILGLSLNCLSPLCLLLLQIFPTMSPTWYYVASGSSGLVNWVSVTLSALADVLPPHLRAAGFGILLATFSLGFALSPILAAILDEPFHVTIVCCSLLAVAWIWTYMSLPETVDPEVAKDAIRTNAIARREWNSCGNTEVCGWKLSFAFIYRPVFELSILNRSYLFRLLSALAFFSGMVGTADRTLLLYYVEERLSFNNHDVAVMFMLSGILGILVQGILIKPLIGCFGERYIVVIAFVSSYPVWIHTPQQLFHPIIDFCIVRYLDFHRTFSLD
jgi:MFS transporter, DHA1 family, tetracycline resistance protein